MNRSLVVAAMLLASPAAFAGEPSKCPSAAFKSLPLSERNLAVYDAFWENLDNHHYDRQMLARSDVRALREQGRKQAAAVEHPAHLYGQVFNSITRQLPDARVTAELPSAPRRYSKSPEEQDRLSALLFGGPGFEEATLRRGSRNVRVVTEVAPDSPAEQAGISPGWRLVSLKATPDAAGKTVQFAGEFLPLDASAALAWERGELSSEIPDPAKVLRINYAHRLQPARRPIERRTVGRGVSYLRFDGFGDDAFMKPVYQAVREAGPDGLIIDLRWNGGGHTHQARKVAGMLLGEDVLMGYQKDARGSDAIHTSSAGRQYQGPLVLLIGPTSGSSSEILAAAIQDHRRGKLVGRMTNGSLVDTDVFPLPDGGSMSIPTRDFRSAMNRRLDGVGVTPDIRVLPTIEDVRAGRDATLDRALRFMNAFGGGGGAMSLPELRYRRGDQFPPI